MTRAPDATDDPESVPASGTRRKSFQVRHSAAMLPPAIAVHVVLSPLSWCHCCTRLHMCVATDPSPPQRPSAAVWLRCYRLKRGCTRVQARRPPDFGFTKHLPRSGSVLPDDSDDQREGERSPSASGSSHVRTASEPPPAAQTQSALPAGAASPTAMAEAALSFASAGPRLRLDSP